MKKELKSGILSADHRPNVGRPSAGLMLSRFLLMFHCTLTNAILFNQQYIRRKQYYIKAMAPDTCIALKVYLFVCF